MDEAQLEAALAEIAHKHARLEVAAVQPGHALSADLGYDSLALLMLLSDLEDRFKLEFPLERIEELQDVTFGQLVELVGAHLNDSDRDRAAKQVSSDG